MRLALRLVPPCCASAPVPPSCIAIAMRSMQPFLYDCAKNVFNSYSRRRAGEVIRMKSTSKRRTPSIVNLTVKRRYLTHREIERLMDCARKHCRYGHRDATMILVAYRHGLALGGLRPAMAADRALREPPPRSPRQKWDSQRTSDPR